MPTFSKNHSPLRRMTVSTFAANQRNMPQAPTMLLEVGLQQWVSKGRFVEFCALPSWVFALQEHHLMCNGRFGDIFIAAKTWVYLSCICNSWWCLKACLRNLDNEHLLSPSYILDTLKITSHHITKASLGGQNLHRFILSGHWGKRVSRLAQITLLF